MGGCSDAKVTTMILNVDLDCCPCYLKVKKLLCKFPQIRDQVFDDKQNTVTITVVCCSPEKIRDKLCEKGGKSIKGIAIKESKKADPEKSKPKSEDKSKGGDEQKEKKEKSKGEDEKKEKKEKSKGDDEKKEKKEKSKSDDEKPKSKSGDDNKDKDKDKDKEKGSGEKSKEKKVSFDQSDAPKQKEAAPAPAAAAAQAWMAEAEAQWMPGYPPGPPPQVYPVTVYYGGAPSYCYDGVAVAPPCYQNQPPCYQNQQGYGYSYSHQPHYANRSDYLNDENPAACSIM